MKNDVVKWKGRYHFVSTCLKGAMTRGNKNIENYGVVTNILSKEKNYWKHFNFYKMVFEGKTGLENLIMQKKW